jgi:hypothetical protein
LYQIKTKDYIGMGFNNIYKLIFNFEVEPICQLFTKKSTCMFKEHVFVPKMIFHDSNFGFRFNKRIVSMFGSCVDSNKKMWT